MSSPRRVVGFVNVAHFFDHYLLLIFPTAVLAMGPELGADYGSRLALATGSFVAFGALSLPAGWLGDRWSRRKMLAIFFIGAGLACILTGLSNSVLALAAGLTLIGAFGAIYHPVGTAMLVAAAGSGGRSLGLNGVFGNVGVALAAVVTGALAQAFGWRAAFIAPGLASIAVGVAYLAMIREEPPRPPAPARKAGATGGDNRVVIAAALALTFLAGGITFNGATISLPKLVLERLPDLAANAAAIGAIATAIYLAGALTQLAMGRLVERFAMGPLFVMTGMMQAVGLGGVALIGGPAGLLFAVIALAATFGQVIVNDVIIARSVPDAWRARAYSVRYVLTFTASTLALPLVAALHSPERGLTPVYVALACFGLVIAAASLVYLLAARAPAPAPQPAE
jgi:MFS family permease